MGFDFVNTTRSRTALTNEDRRIITRTARRAAAATRRSRNDNKAVNVLQVPDFLLQNEHDHALIASGIDFSSERNPSAEPPHNATDAVANVASDTLLIVQPMSVVPPELAILIKPTIAQDVIVRAAGMDVNWDPRRWVKISQLIQSPLLQSLVQLYGHSTCLNAASQCVAERLRYCLEPSSNSAKLDKAYGKAIRKLAHAVAGGIADWSIWYSTLLLTLVELLDESNALAWIIHSNGAFRILESLGPGYIKSDLDKDMFVAHVELVTLEATFGNKSLFLEQPEWQHAILLAASENPSHFKRSNVVMAFWKIAVRIPGLLKEATEIVMDNKIGDAQYTLTKIQDTLDDLSLWLKMWKEQSPPSTTMLELAMEMKGFTFLALLSRCSVALHVEFQHEQTAQSAADHIIRLAIAPENGTIMTLHTRVYFSIAQSVFETSAQWASASQHPSTQMISPATLGQWFAKMGRVTIYAGTRTFGT